MHFRVLDGHSFTIPGGTTGVLYPAHPKGEQSVAVVKLDGVYPEKGYSLNDVCTETLYVLEGEIKMYSLEVKMGSGTDSPGETEPDPKEYTLEPGDLFMIVPGNKYRLTGKGRACVLITPAWDSKQNHIVEE